MNSYLLADDHSIVRSGIRCLIKDHFSYSFIHEAGKEDDIVVMIQENYYDLVILDIIIPDADFLSLLRRIKMATPTTQVLVFTACPEQRIGVRCMQAGASGFLSKTVSNTEFVAAIRKVHDNKKCVSPTLAELLLRSKTGEQHTNPFNLLSTREMEIVTLLHQGKKLPEICQSLNIQYSTGNTYKRRIFEKLDIVNLISLVQLVQAHGLVK